MTNQLPPELFAQPPVRSEFARKRSFRIRRIITSFIVLAAIGGGLFWKFGGTHQPEEIPTIKADLPLKEKPEQPGGIEIPHQDVLAYQQLDSNGNPKPEAEHMLPPPEVPQPVAAAPSPAGADQNAPQAPAAVETLQPPSMKIESLMAPSSPAPVATTATQNASQAKPSSASAAPAPQVPVVSLTTLNNPTVSSVNPAPHSAPPSNQKAVQEASQAEAPEAKVASVAPLAKKHVEKKAEASGKAGFRVQLAAFPDRETALASMARMQKKYASSLAGAELHVVKADLGARGIFYRIQSSPITDKEAHHICALLTSAKAGCIVVKP